MSVNSTSSANGEQEKNGTDGKSAIDMEAQIKSLFDRAYSAIGKHYKSVNFWLIWIDYQTSLYNMGFVNFICYQAV